MPDMGAIAGLITGINGIKTIAQSIIAERDAALVREKTTALSASLLSVLGDAIAAQAEQSVLLKRIDDLEKEIEKVKAWDAQKARYEMRSTADGGAIVMVLKPDAQGSEPPHWACQACFQKGVLSALNRMGHPQRGRGIIWACHSCRSEILADWNGPNVTPVGA